jgi:hypothetical protein
MTISKMMSHISVGSVGVSILVL